MKKHLLIFLCSFFIFNCVVGQEFNSMIDVDGNLYIIVKSNKESLKDFNYAKESLKNYFSFLENKVTNILQGEIPYKVIKAYPDTETFMLNDFENNQLIQHFKLMPCNEVDRDWFFEVSAGVYTYADNFELLKKTIVNASLDKYKEFNSYSKILGFDNISIDHNKDYNNFFKPFKISISYVSYEKPVATFVNSEFKNSSNKNNSFNDKNEKIAIAPLKKSIPLKQFPCNLEIKHNLIKLYGNLMYLDITFINHSKKIIDNIEFSVDYYNIYEEYLGNKSYTWEPGLASGPSIKPNNKLTFKVPTYIDSKENIKKYVFNPIRLHNTDDTFCNIF
jgi:hypothetical protein